ncbi:MAG: PQQ-binding-like beta-propeller repeat protein [Alphaproteobacteria bacterium]|nr:PQQ-binding-like beta-propeller repeat protein [Alphaproteobacteria bacterium]
MIKSFVLAIGVSIGLASIAHAQSGADWPNFGNDSGGSQYSPLDQIDASNVADLEVAWIHRSGDFKKNPFGTSLQAVPIQANDLLYYCTPFNRVFALDPATGEEVWVFDPHAPDADTGDALIEGERLSGTCRGVAYWEAAEPEDGAACQKRVLKGDRGGNLWAIDADTGEACMDFGADAGHPGRVSNADYEMHGEGYVAMPSPGAVVGDVVVGATASNDGVQNANDGFVRGWDVRTGELKWEFNPIPQDRRDQSGAANVWSTMSADQDRNLVFLPTTSPSTDYYGGSRRFPIPYSDAIVAVEAETGGVAWHFQTVRHDLFDYDLVGHPLLVTIEKDGEPREVAVLQTKMGWLFVFDRETGEPVWPIEEMAAHETNLPEDEAAPTQPVPTLPVAFAGQNIDRDDLFGLTPLDRAWCQSEFDEMRYEGLYTPPDLREALLFPSALGGGNWGGAAFDPDSNTLIIKAENLASRLRLEPKGDRADEDITRIDYLTRPLKDVPYAAVGELFMSPLGIPCTPTPWGTLAAIDMSSGQMKWQIPLGQIKRFGITIPASFGWGSPNIGGPIITGSGLIFIAATMDDKIRAIDLESGDELWQAGLPHQGSAIPVTYMANGRQYVVIAAGGTSRVSDNLGDAIVAFALPED